LLPYIGSGPYCFSNSLGMALGAGAPSPSLLEVLTGSPFGFQLLEGVLPFFDPFGWDPEAGLDAAIELLGYSCERSDGDDAAEALDRLRAAADRGPVLVGPVDMGLLLHQPGSGGATGADHYVVVLTVDADTVVFHDPHGHPYATLPTAEFLQAWQAEEISYIERTFVLRTSFVRRREVTADAALRASLPGAVAWLGVRGDREVPPGSLPNEQGLEVLADRITSGELDPEIREMMEKFAVRVGARRLSDASVALAYAGYAEPARLLGDQARLLGGLQYPLVTGDDTALAAGLRRLAPTYDEVHAALSKAVDAQAGA
jgi:hypothetical protein